MKYISFAIPSYNSQEYMAKAIESILPGKEEVEMTDLRTEHLRSHMNIWKSIRTL